MFTVTIFYIILLAVFFVLSGLVLRHTVKFSYLSPRFKTVMILFGLMATAVIVFSLYLLIQLYNGSSQTSIGPSIPSGSNSGSSSGNFNF